MKNEKKTLFDKIMDHSIDIALLATIGTYATAILANVLSPIIMKKRREDNRMNNIKELSELGANINVNLEGDI